MSFVLSVILGIVFRILLAIAINLDCRARNIGARKIYTVLTVFFPAIIGIVYAIKRKGEKKELKVCRSCGTKASAYSAKCPKCGGLFLMDYTPPKAKQLKTASIILCVIALIAFGVNQAYSLPSEIEDIKSEIMGAENPEDVEEDYVDVVIATDYASYTNSRGRMAGWIDSVVDRVCRAYAGDNGVDNQAISGIISYE